MKALKEVGAVGLCIAASFIHTGSLWELAGVSVCIVLATLLAWTNRK